MELNKCFNNFIISHQSIVYFIEVYNIDNVLKFQRYLFFINSPSEEAFNDELINQNIKI